MVFPVWQNFLGDLEFMLLNTLKMHFSLTNSLFLFPVFFFFSPPNFTQVNSAAQFQTLTAADPDGSQSVGLKDVLTCSFSTPTAYKLSSIPLIAWS